MNVLERIDKELLNQSYDLTFIIYPVHGEVYSIQHYEIKFFSDLQQVSGFFRVLQFPPPIKLTRHDITEILLKVVFNTIYPNPILFMKQYMAIERLLLFQNTDHYQQEYLSCNA